MAMEETLAKNFHLITINMAAIVLIHLTDLFDDSTASDL